MAYRCLECGHIFEDGEQARWVEHHPYGMSYATESFSGCPLCKGEFGETKQCKICGGEFLEDELEDGVCDICLTEYSANLNLCYKISEKLEKEQISINPFFIKLLDVGDIEAILFEEIKKMKLDCKPFIDDDKEWFIEKLIEEVSK